MQTLKRSERKRSDPTFAHEPAPKAPPAAAPSKPAVPDADPIDGFLTVLVTPKLTFSLPRRASWATAEDIPQQELREAFLSRFPVRFPDVDKVAFQCATPALALAGQERIVYRIGSTGGGDDERVLLQILSSLDKAYAARYEQKIEEARADMLSSSMTFQVVADEIRTAQEECARRWEKEVRALKEQMSTNQKRLFLLEREKEGLAKAASSSEGIAGQLRQSVGLLTRENAQLREAQSALESQVAALREVVTAHLASGAAAPPATDGADPAAVVRRDAVSVSTQTAPDGEAGEAEAGTRLALERWQQQISAMSEWLRTGAELLGTPGGAPELAAAAALGAQSPVLVDPTSGAGEAAGERPSASDC